MINLINTAAGNMFTSANPAGSVSFAQKLLRDNKPAINPAPAQGQQLGDTLKSKQLELMRLGMFSGGGNVSNEIANTLMMNRRSGNNQNPEPKLDSALKSKRNDLWKYKMIAGLPQMSISGLEQHFKPEQMPAVDASPLGRYRLVESLKNRYGPMFRNVMGVSGIIGDYDNQAGAIKNLYMSMENLWQRR